MNTNIKKLFSPKGIINLVLILVAALFPVIMSGADAGVYLLLVGGFILCYIIAVSGLDILFGYCGQISLGHAGFFAIGSYGSAILNSELGIPPMISTLLAALLAVIISVIVAYPAAGLRFHFLSLATQAFGWIIYYFVVASPGEITGNYVGYFPEPFSIFGIELAEYKSFFYFALIMCIIFLIIKAMLINSKTGRAFIAIRENVTAANGMGINVRRYKIIAFATSAFYVSFAGSLYGHLSGYISPTTYTVAQSTLFFVMLLFGGNGTFYGPIIGAVVIQIVTELVRNAQEFQQVIYGLFLLLIIMFMPNGILSLQFNKLKKLFVKNKKDEVNEDVEG